MSLRATRSWWRSNLPSKPSMSRQARHDARAITPDPSCLPQIRHKKVVCQPKFPCRIWGRCPKDGGGLFFMQTPLATRTQTTPPCFDRLSTTPAAWTPRLKRRDPPTQTLDVSTGSTRRPRHHARRTTTSAMKYPLQNGSLHKERPANRI